MTKMEDYRGFQKYPHSSVLYQFRLFWINHLQQLVLLGEVEKVNFKRVRIIMILYDISDSSPSLMNYLIFKLAQRQKSLRGISFCSVSK